MDALHIIRDAGPPRRLRVLGEIDLMNAGEIVTAAAQEGGDDRLVLDLSGVTYFDSSGVRALLELREQLGDHLVVVPNPRVLQILEILGLRHAFEFAGGQDGPPDI